MNRWFRLQRNRSKAWVKGCEKSSEMGKEPNLFAVNYCDETFHSFYKVEKILDPARRFVFSRPLKLHVQWKVLKVTLPCNQEFIEFCLMLHDACLSQQIAD